MPSQKARFISEMERLLNRLFLSIAFRTGGPPDRESGGRKGYFVSGVEGGEEDSVFFSVDVSLPFFGVPSDLGSGFGLPFDA
jgi:hypothetical protein